MANIPPTGGTVTCGALALAFPPDATRPNMTVDISVAATDFSPVDAGWVLLETWKVDSSVALDLSVQAAFSHPLSPGWPEDLTFFCAKNAVGLGIPDYTVPLAQGDTTDGVAQGYTTRMPPQQATTLAKTTYVALVLAP
jgi:hypothetical protein